MKVEKIEIKETARKDFGVFANVPIKKDEIIISYTLDDADRIVTAEQTRELSEYERNHLMPLGDDRYALDTSLPGIVNHSCEPNCYVDFDENFHCKLIAIKDIDLGEEITKDYVLGALDQINNEKGWLMDCNCGTPHCRKKIHGDFFKMPPAFQKTHIQFLPAYLQKKFQARLKGLLQEYAK